MKKKTIVRLMGLAFRVGTKQHVSIYARLALRAKRINKVINGNAALFE